VCKFNINLIYIFILILTSCSGETESNNSPTATEDEEQLFISEDTTSADHRNDTIKINYSFYYINNKDDLDSFSIVFSDLERRVISDLNRIDEKKIKPVDSIVIPNPLIDKLIFYSPFPFKIKNIGGVKKILILNRKIQAFAGYEDGNLIRWGPVSSGRRNRPTPAGLFFTNWKAKSTISTVDEGWLMNWYFNIHNYRGIAIHEYAMPGYPASHACVRLKEEDAVWFYEWAAQWILSPDERDIIAYGTPVLIYDDYDFDNPPPWKRLVGNPDFITQRQENLADTLQIHLETIFKRQSIRDSLEKIVF
jgi:hypothetical protein